MLKIYEFIEKLWTIHLLLLLQLYIPHIILVPTICPYLQYIFKYFKLTINQSTCFLSIIFFQI